MDVPATVRAVRDIHDDTFTSLDLLCSRPADQLHHRPDYPHAWTPAEHPEHVSLASSLRVECTVGSGRYTDS